MKNLYVLTLEHYIDSSENENVIKIEVSTDLNVIEERVKYFEELVHVVDVQIETIDLELVNNESVGVYLHGIKRDK
ncbi:MAG: hypothetical protein ACRCX2_01810 [Paraclostridium sp.]